VRSAVKVAKSSGRLKRMGDGWVLVATRGGRRQYEHPSKRGRVTVPGKLSDDLAPGTLNSIRKQAGLRRKAAMRYAVVVEKAGNDCSAYVPDLPGCMASGTTLEEVEAESRDAVRFHIEGLKEGGLDVPEPTGIAEYVDA
jgi:predicted RNA binding protein YcfA (HicA-like mRNA interferase family)/predicted RNase H-like HicB family nuclease